jgi:glycosyltransferase involved in cell wall biosynthesis
MSTAITVILTFNSEASVGQVIESVKNLSKRIVVVDSYSKDGTVALAQDLGCEVVQHEFLNYAAQRNWAQEYIKAAPDDWVLHLDSDEVVSPELNRSLAEVIAANTTEFDGFLMQRVSLFWGKPIRHGQINPSWHLRLYRASKGFCEERLYDQHYVCEGKTKKLKGILVDLQAVTVEVWTAAHNRWSTAEAQEAIAMRALAEESDRQLKPTLFGDLRQQKRWLKNMVWYRSPLFVRAFVFFFYSYFLRLGFLDGVHGMVYHVLQSFWFRFLVDAKIYEIRSAQRPEKVKVPELVA